MPRRTVHPACMYDPVIYQFRRAYPAAAPVARPPFRPQAELRCADGQQYYTCDAFDLAHCFHDGADTFFASMEIHAREDLRFPISCSHFDLHGCYVETGTLAVAEPNGRRLALQTGQYALVYAPEAEYTVSVARGVTVVRLWSTNDRTLMREHTRAQLTPLANLLRQWAARAPRCYHSRVIPFDKPCRATWDRLAALPHLRPLTMDNRLRETITELIYCCVDMLHESRKDSNRPLALVHAVRAKAIKLIREGVVPKILELAADHGVSDSYLRRVHRKYYHGSPQDFIMGLRLRKAHELIVGDRESKRYTYTQIAYMVGFTCVQDLNKQYKKLYTYLPHETNDLLFGKE
ncbi:helix-turn-helix domain-containing protein [Parapedobacter sp. 2B3]|uniref:helix-turn-helix transcriptional regulator n=1 Tax=Parapedobacter sp. 2B3 TaxID=3342381 RepID=UPI0035B5BB9A